MRSHICLKFLGAVAPVRGLYANKHMEAFFSIAGFGFGNPRTFPRKPRTFPRKPRTFPRKLRIFRIFFSGRIGGSDFPFRSVCSLKWDPRWNDSLNNWMKILTWLRVMELTRVSTCPRWADSTTCRSTLTEGTPTSRCKFLPHSSTCTLCPSIKVILQSLVSNDHLNLNFDPKGIEFPYCNGESCAATAINTLFRRVLPFATKVNILNGGNYKVSCQYVSEANEWNLFVFLA